MKKIRVFLLLYVLLNLHVARNLSLGGYLLVLLPVYAVVILASGEDLLSARVGKVGQWYFLFVASAMWASLITFLDYGLVEGAYSAVRYFLTMPMACVAYWACSNPKSAKGVLLAFCYIVLLGSLTIPLQYLLGPIHWVTEPGVRANMVRYASMLGSLTITGTVLPYAVLIALTLHINKFMKISLVVALIICSAFTFQKAALVGIPLAILLYLCYDREHRIWTILALGLAVVSIGIATNILLRDWAPWATATRYALAAFQIGESSVALGWDFTVQQSLVARLTTLPQQSLADLYSYRGPIGFLFGGGFGMVGEALMRPGDSEFITSHNGYIDLVLIGGLVHLVAFLGLACNIRGAIRADLRSNGDGRMSTDVSVALIGLVTLMLLSFLGGGALTYQPVTGCLFWTVAGIAWRSENRLRSEARGIRCCHRRLSSRTSVTGLCPAVPPRSGEH